jgi:two-component system, response regulator
MKRSVEIILVEDNRYEAQLTIRALTLKLPDFQYVHLHDGEEALNFIFAREQYQFRQGIALPALILLDLGLPKVSGVEVLRTLKTDPLTRKIPVVVLTMSNHTAEQQLCYELGANSFIRKPVDFPKFTDAIIDIGQYWLLRNQLPT